MQRFWLGLGLLMACGGGSSQQADAGPGGEIACAILPADNPWNTSIEGADVHPQSDDFIDSIGVDRNMHPDFGSVFEGNPIGIPYVVVDDSTPLVEISFDVADESDPGPYPIPPDAQVEAGGDRHVIAINNQSCELFELFDAEVNSDGSWNASSGARFDLDSNALRPEGFTSADAAGLPIFPGLVRYQEVVEEGAINHAIRVTVRRSQRGYIHPATHAAGSDDPMAPPMGLRLRMKSDFDCSTYSTEIRVLCATFKTYGLIVADNGSSWFVSGAPDPRWDDDALRDIRNIPGNAFEAVDSGSIIPQ